MGRAHSILIVEDEEAIRKLIVRLLESHGFHAIHTGEAGQALSLLQSATNEIDLAIVDMVMPGTSGLDFAAALERECPAVKILYISGYVDSIAVEVIHRRSPHAILLKPFSEKDLLDRVNFLLDSPGSSAAQ
jgi:two-component system, cell cycle sensor histidine kinase and response regulator CckA